MDSTQPNLEGEDTKPVDFMIADRVREAILRDKRLASDAGSIRVATQDGIVTLVGFVTTEAVRERAASVAKSVGGVKRIDNQLVVDAEAAKKTQQPMESVVDRAISDRVRLALQRDRTTAPALGRVTVLTHDGIVRLSGTVDSEAVKARFTAVANPVGSVKRVENQLEVKGP